MLSQRVDEMAAHNACPTKQSNILPTRSRSIADKIDRTPALPDANEIFFGIEQRFDVLSGLIERRQGDALEQGNMLFRELERRLDEVADKIDQRQTDAALDSAGIMDAIDAALLGAGQAAGDAASRTSQRKPPSAAWKPARRYLRAARPVGQPVCRHRPRH